MEFPFNINHLFSERFSILDKTLVAGRIFLCPKTIFQPGYEQRICALCPQAQKLTTPVTSATKMQSQHHQLYLMKDGESRGAIVGFLKVGYKKLFLLDPQGLHVEAEPLCVLDFFITENLQRHGHGLELFHFMLQKMEPALMAYDRPSPKLLSFLAKHYRLTQSVPQVRFVDFLVSVDDHDSQIHLFADFFFLTYPAVPLAQPRSIAPKKPDGEIKPYSIAEREGSTRQQNALFCDGRRSRDGRVYLSHSRCRRLCFEQKGSASLDLVTVPVRHRGFGRGQASNLLVLEVVSGRASIQ
uniref:Alpha-tubulin N-acetyltransferase 1 n=1 Tax=Hippocampus comes TaxID=109280 RepID=A0A3Q2YQ55_HIPCM